MSNERGFIGRLFLLIVAAGALWYAYGRWGAAYNLRSLSGEVENSVNRALTASGVKDSQIINQLHTERSWGPLIWVENQRRLQIADAEQLARLQSRLAVIAARYHCALDVQKDGTLTTDRLHFFSIDFQRLTLLTGPEAAAETSVPVAPTPPAAVTGPRLAIVIDDVAATTEPMDHFASLGIPLTFAILPRDRHCRDLAQKAHDMQFPVILHLPMEPIDLAHNDPGTAGLYLNMSTPMLHQQFEKDVASIPYMVGINNHMGSAFTENLEKMELVMHWVKQQHVFFLDSRTSVKSIVPKAAREAGVPCLINDTFLDNSDTVAGIEEQLDIAMKLATRYKQSVAIGHYRRKHLVEALAAKLPEFKARGITLVFLPSLVPTIPPR